MIPAKPFINLLRRASKSKYQTLIMHNRMLMQCYDLDVDSDVGLHYILFIPDTPEYQDDFYNETIILPSTELLTTYTLTHRAVDEIRKARDMKPKDLTEEVYVLKDSIRFLYYLQGELEQSVELSIEHAAKVVETTKDMINVLKQYTTLADRIKPGGICLEYNGRSSGLQERVTNTADIFYYNVKCGGKRIRIPLCKSMFLGIKELDLFKFNVQETTIDDVYIYTIHLGKNKIEEVFWGYLINY